MRSDSTFELRGRRSTTSVTRHALCLLALLTLPTTIHAADRTPKPNRGESRVENSAEATLQKSAPNAVKRKKGMVKTRPAEAMKANPALGKSPGVTVPLPDLWVTVGPPSSSSAPAIGRVYNSGSVPPPAPFLTLATIEESCEEGEAPTQVPAISQPFVPAIEPGTVHVVGILPDGGWIGGCNYVVKLRADQWGTVAEEQENNNASEASFCAKGLFSPFPVPCPNY